MNVLNYLNSNQFIPNTTKEKLESLSEEYSIKISQNERYPDLYCLNYDQINSPKYNDITKECRSLVIGWDGGKFYVVSRSFDRFFNLGEDPEHEVDITQLTAYEKIDGSLVGVFCYNGEWLYRTRSMIMPDESLTINGTTTTWKDLIESQIEPCSHFMQENCTYIFEIVSPENRVVTRYPERKAYLLQIRNNISGQYTFYEYKKDVAFMGGWNVPKQYFFDSLDHCLQSAKDLPELQEGYVMYNKHGEPVVKVKNPAYVAAHHLRGEGVLSGKRIMDLIFMNEHLEYLTIFPEDKERFKPYLEAIKNAMKDYTTLWATCRDKEDQKDFALAVKDYPVCGLLFYKKKNPDCTFDEAFNRNTQKAKYRLVEAYL